MLSLNLDILFRIFLLLVSLFLVWLVYWQHKQGKELKSELALLDKLKKHNVEYDFILKAMRLAVWHIDPQHRTVTYENDHREKMDGFLPPPDTPLEEIIKHYGDNDRQRMAQSLDDICEGRVDEFHEVYQGLSWYSGSKYWSESYAAVVQRDAEGKPSKIVGTSMRIDERKAMEEALVQARNRAEESDRLKSAFIANMSHEIRTPLNAIVGFTSVLPDVADAAERQSLLDLIHENTQKLLRIVDDVVNISKVEAGKEELVLTAFDLNLTLKEQTDISAGKANAGVVVSTQFANEAQQVTTDRNRLIEIIRHLLSNATKFTSSGSITVGYDAPHEGRIRIWVADTGKGISEEHQQRIFERFFKVDEFIPGAGLGLSICRTMAYSLGGNVGVISKLGEGSTFWVEIPIQ